MNVHGPRPSTGTTDASPGAPAPGTAGSSAAATAAKEKADTATKTAEPAEPGEAARPEQAAEPEHTPEQAAQIAQARRQRRNRRILVNVARLVVVVIAIGSWQVLSSSGTIDKFYFGTPSGICSKLSDWVRNGTSQGSLWDQVWTTLEETLLGFLIGVGGGVVFGVILGRLRFLSDVFSPYIKTLNSIPRILLGSVFTVWLGLGISSKVTLSAVLVFFGVFFNAFQGAREVDRNLIANARILGASRSKVTLQVVVPSSLSWITTSLHVAFGFAVTGAIVGELLGAQQGLGLLIFQAQANFDPDGVYAGLVITAAFALAAEGLITLLERRLLRWQPRPQQSSDGL